LLLQTRIALLQERVEEIEIQKSRYLAALQLIQALGGGYQAP